LSAAGTFMNKRINWESIVRKLGIDKSGVVAFRYAGEAIDEILGRAQIRGIVDYYVHRNSTVGSELARGVLNRLRSWAAMQRCYVIYKSKQDIQTRRRAVELLRSIGDKRVLPWIKEFLRDPDQEIQNWGIGALDMLLFSGLVNPMEAKEIIQIAEKHKSEFVRDTMNKIKIVMKMAVQIPSRRGTVGDK